MFKLVEMRFGSHLYGTATPSSDTDIKAVHIPSAGEILLQRAKPVWSRKTKADPNTKNTADDVDYESYALHKYLALVTEGQTVATDMLFAIPSVWMSPPSPAWHGLIANRGALLSRNCKSFLGYCRQQANKYGIKGSRMAAARDASEMLTEATERLGKQAKLREIEPALDAFVIGREHTALIDIPVSDGKMIVRHLEVCNRKAPLTATIARAAEIYTLLFKEYGQRARAAMVNEGIDWKALSHAVRVGREAIELLSTAHVTFPRPEASHLLAIKTGALAYQTVAEEIEVLLSEVESAAERSTLPEMPDMVFVEDFIADQYCRSITQTLF
jgi:hypothetical protein